MCLSNFFHVFNQCYDTSYVVRINMSHHKQVNNLILWHFAILGPNSCCRFSTINHNILLIVTNPNTITSTCLKNLYDHFLYMFY